MAVIASVSAGALVALGFALLLALVFSGVYAAGHDDWKLKHWIPAIAIIVALVVVVAKFLNTVLETL